MEYIEGRTLAQVMEDEGVLPVERSLEMFIQIADAIAHAHSCGVLHRDVKPANIMILRSENAEESVKILDFGIAKISNDPEHHDNALTKTGDAIGSPMYMSPEQGAGTGNRPACRHIFSRLRHVRNAYGRAAFPGRTAFETMLKHLHEQPECFDQASLGREVPASLESIVLRALAKEKEKPIRDNGATQRRSGKGARQKKPHLLAQGRAAPNQRRTKRESHIA